MKGSIAARGKSHSYCKISISTLTNCGNFYFREVEEELLRKAKEKVTMEICLALIKEGVGDETQNLAVDVLEEEKAERDAKLQLLVMQVKRNRTARYFKR